MLVSFDSVKPFCTTVLVLRFPPFRSVGVLSESRAASLAELHVPRLALVGRVDHLQDGQL